MNITGFNDRFQGREYTKFYDDGVKLKRDKVFRITIFSKDGLSGAANHTDNIYFVNMPDDIHEPNKYHIAVESFIADCASTTQKPVPILIEFLDINQPDTYNTSTQTNSRIAACCTLEGTGTWNGTSAGFRNWINYQRSITSDTVGIPLMDTSIMRSKQLRIQLKSVSDAVLATNILGTNSNWVMTLVAFPFSP